MPTIFTQWTHTPFRSQSSGNLLDQTRPCDSSSANFPTPLTAYAHIVSHNYHIDFHSPAPCFLHRHSKVQYIARVVHDHHQHALALVHAVQNASPDLLRARRRKDSPGNRSGKKSGSNKRGEGWLVAGAAAADNGDLRGGRRMVSDLVGKVDCHRWIRMGEGEKCGVDEVRRVVYEVFRCAPVSQSAARSIN